MEGEPRHVPHRRAQSGSARGQRIFVRNRFRSLTGGQGTHDCRDINAGPQVLQENGYLVLRFLAEDVGNELDIVLDSILRAISHRMPAPPKLLTIVNRP